ncbi:MAG: hypothetical protein RIT02_2138 [Planctomycetota bacterium]
MASERSACSVARQNSQAETIRRRHPSNHPPGQSTAGQSTGGGSRWGTHSGCGAARPRGHLLQRGRQDGLGLQAGPSIGDTQQRQATKNGPNQPQQPPSGDCRLGSQEKGAVQQRPSWPPVGTRIWGLSTGGPTRRGYTTGTANRGHNSWGHSSWGHSSWGHRLGGIHIRPGPSIRDTHPPAEAWLPNRDSDAQTGPSIGGHRTSAAAGPPSAAGAARGAGTPSGAIHRGHPSKPFIGDSHWGQPPEDSPRDHPPHSGCGATLWDGAIRRGLTAGCQCSEPANDHPAGTHNRNSQRRMGPTKRNSHQATTASGGPTKRSHTTVTADRGHSQPGTQLVWRHIRPGPSIKDTQWRHPSGHNSKQLQVPPNRGSQRELQPGHQLGTHIPQPRRGHTIGTATRQQTGGSPNGDIHRGTPNSHRGHPPGTASRDSRRFAVLGAIRPGQPAGTARGDTHPERSGCGTTNCSGCGKRGGPQAGPSIGDIHRGHPSGTASRGQPAGDTQRGTHSGDIRVETPPRTTQTGQQVRTHVPHPRRGHPTGTATRQKPGGSPNRDTKWGHSTGTVSRDSLRVASSRNHPTGAASGDIQVDAALGDTQWGHTTWTANRDYSSWVYTSQPGPTTGANHRGHPPGPSNRGHPSGPSNRSHPSEPSIGAIQRGHPSGHTHMATHNLGHPTQSPPPRRRDPTTQSDSC